MPRYFVYMSAQGLLLAGKILEWKFKVFFTRDKYDIFLTNERTRLFLTIVWLILYSKFAVRVEQIRTTRPS